jgi:uncharacterized protein DUF4349
MSRREEMQMNTEMRRELDAIEAALRGEATAVGDASIADLARALQAMRPQPRDEFSRALDARAERGFRRDRRHGGPVAGLALAAGPAHPPRRRAAALAATARDRWRRRRALLLLPALGLTVAVVAIAVVLSSSGSGGAPTAARSQTSSAGRAFQLGPSGPPVPATSQGASTARAGAVVAEPPVTAPPTFATPGSRARQVERSSLLDVGVAPGSIQSASQRVFTLVSGAGGYVRQSNVSAGPGAMDGGASFDLRVPTSNLAATIAALSHLGRMRSENDSTTDVSDQWGSLQRSLGDLRAQRASLLGQLARATDAHRAAALRGQLAGVERRIDATAGAIAELRARIDYTRLSLSLTPESSGSGATGSLTPGGAAHNAAKILSAALAVLLIAGAAVLPLAIVVVAGWLVIALARRRLREQALDAG